MRIKTAKEVQNDVFKLVLGSPLAEGVNGRVYRNGQRPRDRKDYEDIIVTHTSSDPMQKQVGVVTINIYVPDIDPLESGQMMEDVSRTIEIETMAADWVSCLNIERETDYTFELHREINTIADQDTEAHIVVIQLKYTIFNI